MLFLKRFFILFGICILVFIGACIVYNLVALILPYLLHKSIIEVGFIFVGSVALLAGMWAISVLINVMRS